MSCHHANSVRLSTADSILVDSAFATKLRTPLGIILYSFVVFLSPAGSVQQNLLVYFGQGQVVSFVQHHLIALVACMTSIPNLGPVILFVLRKFLAYHRLRDPICCKNNI